MPKLYTATGLAAVLGVNRGYVQAMKRGFMAETGELRRFRFTHGLRTEARAAADWLAANPDFRKRKAYRQSSSNRGRFPHVSPVDKCGER